MCGEEAGALGSWSNFKIAFHHGVSRYFSSEPRCRTWTWTRVLLERKSAFRLLPISVDSVASASNPAFLCVCVRVYLFK